MDLPCGGFFVAALIYRPAVKIFLTSKTPFPILRVVIKTF
jgi:hypothetical protein